MPLTINVGLSRKASENYQSQGVSINVTAELDQSLLAKPGRLQEEIAGLYEQAEVAMDNQQLSPGTPGSRSSNSHRSTSGGGSPRAATGSQLRALRAIADRLDLDLDAEVQDEFGYQPDQLDVRQASQMIDLLKARQNGDREVAAAGTGSNGNGSGRGSSRSNRGNGRARR